MGEPIFEGTYDAGLHAALASVRATSPTAIDARSGALVVLHHDDIERLAHDPAAVGIGLSVFDFLGIGDGPLRRWYGSLMFTNDGDDHHRLRRLVARAFTPSSVERHRRSTRALVEERLTEIRSMGVGDLVSALADVPITVICRLLGVPVEEVPAYLAYADDLSPVFGFMDPAQIERATLAIAGLLADVETTIQRRLDEATAREAARAPNGASDGLADGLCDGVSGANGTKPPDDLISVLLRAEADGDRLTHDELLTIVSNLIVGGHDTRASQIGCTLFTLMRHPEVARAVATGELRVGDVVNETIRYEPSLAVVPRTLVEPRVIDGIERPSGSMLFLMTASANRQPEVWGDPEAVRPGRFDAVDAPRLLSFGTGPHYCLGAALARMTLEEVVAAYAQIADRLEPIGDLDDVVWRNVLGRSPAALLVSAS